MSLSRAYVKLQYIPPKNQQPKKDCTSTALVKPPNISIDTDESGYVTSLVSTEGVGAVIIVIQVVAYIEWSILFKNTFDMPTTETHKVYASLPILTKVPGPRVALMITARPWWLKLPVYGGLIASLFRKIDETEQVLTAIWKLQKGYCPADVKRFEENLQKIQQEADSWLIRAKMRESGEEEMALLMRHKRHGDGSLVGKYIA